METVVAAFNYLGAIIVLRCNEIMIVGHRWSADISASNEGYPKVRNHGEAPYKGLLLVMLTKLPIPYDNCNADPISR